MPKTIVLIGVEALHFELGEGLSPAVKASIPKAVLIIEETMKEIQKTGGFLSGFKAGIRKILTNLIQRLDD
jgi:hypothetical protein